MGGDVRGAALVTPAPALRHLLARGQGVVAETVGRHHHTERRLHLHRSTLQPQPRVAHTGDRVRELDLDDLPQVLSVGVKASLFGSAEHSEDVLGGVGVDQHGKAVVGLLSSAKFLLEIRDTFLCVYTNLQTCTTYLQHEQVKMIFVNVVPSSVIFIIPGVSQGESAEQKL